MSTYYLIARNRKDNSFTVLKLQESWYLGKEKGREDIFTRANDLEAIEYRNLHPEIDLSLSDHTPVIDEMVGSTCTTTGHNAYEECLRCDYTTYEEIDIFQMNRNFNARIYFSIISL